jgi:hypothetical protein
MRKNIKRSGRVYQIDTTRLVGDRLTRRSAELLFAVQHQCCAATDISLTRRRAAQRDYSEGNHRIGREAGRRIDGTLEATAQPIPGRVFECAAGRTMNDVSAETSAPQTVSGSKMGNSTGEAMFGVLR